MWELFKEPIQKQYHSRGLSRSWLLSVACCLFAFIVPILILISIGYSWDTYKLSLYRPILNFQNYQATCLLSTGVVTYDSSFTNQLSANSYQAFVSAGGQGNDIIVTGNFVPSTIDACTLQLYFSVTINSRVPSIAVLALNFYKNTANTGVTMTTVTQTGTIEALLTYSVPQSAVYSGTGLLHYINGSQTLNMVDTHKTYAANKNITLVPSISTSQVTYTTAGGSLSYEGRFSVQASNYIEEVTIVQNLRTFIPFFIYLFILAWVFLAEPTVRWMLENQIYHSKVRHHKLKQH